jgi:hypothetical protein
MAIPIPVARDFSGTGKVAGRVLVLLTNGEKWLALEASAVVAVSQVEGWLVQVEFRRGPEVSFVDILTPFDEVVRLWAEALG